MDTQNALVLQEERSLDDVKRQVIKVQELMRGLMKVDVHYGVIPGTGKKPALLKPGAEKLCFMFRLSPEYDIDREDLPNGHREYRIKTRLRSMASGAVVGEGVGSCSTMESKYRYRNASDFEILDQPIPKDAREKKSEYRKQGFGMKQVDGAWCWVHYKSEGKVENPDIADVYNTVLKMATKRALVSAVITATSASDIFDQDTEEIELDYDGAPLPDPRVDAIYQQFRDFIASGVLPQKTIDGLEQTMANGVRDSKKLESILDAVKRQYDKIVASIDAEAAQA